MSIGSLGRRCGQDLISLYVVHALNYGLPLISVPYLCRTIGLREWGLVGLAQSIAAYIALAVDYGFPLSAIRRVSRGKDNPQVVSEAFAAVTGAKAGIAFAAVVLLSPVMLALPQMRYYAALALVTVIYGCVQGLNCTWLYQALGRAREMAAFEATGKLATVLAILTFIRPHDHAEKVLLISSLGGMAVLMASTVRLALSVPNRATEVGAITERTEGRLARVRVPSERLTLVVGKSDHTRGASGPRGSRGLCRSREASQDALSCLGPLTQVIYPRVCRH